MTLFSKTVKSLKNFNLKPYELILVVLLVLYLVSGVSTPYELSPYINNIFMYLSLFAFSVVLYLYGNPLLALFFLITSFIFIKRSNNVSHKVMKPSQEKKDNTMNKLNNHLNEKTLEEDIVRQIEKHPNNIPGPSSYQPVLCDSHNASIV
tara:strand:+ start:13 stop:462 length:450 start_codon:yes stop_codon:yes gene_type:complete